MIRKIVKKLLWILGGLCVLILIFFVFVIALNCSVPTENRTPYYEGYVALVAEPLAHPEQNGLADLMRAMGPKVFTGWIPNRYDQTAQWDEADRISWSEFRHHPTITEWWEKVWRPNCEKLRVNPEAEPPYWTIASDRLYRRLEGLEKTTPEKQAILEQIEQLNARQQSGPPLTDAELDTLYAYESPYDHAERLSLTPWSRNEEPDAAAYLDEYSPLLDIFAHAVRQPCFIAYTPEPWEMKIHVPVPLPEKSLPPLNLTSLQLTLDQASPELRPLADATRQRAFMRLGAGDLDGSIHDMMTLFHTSCAYSGIFFQKKFF
ncbi:MAG: hypothetical protein PHE53_04510 [Thermoguttaceae bacterium]|nr:hypothetical protein [Thermoguttaceae bacterium]